MTPPIRRCRCCPGRRCSAFDSVAGGRMQPGPESWVATLDPDEDDRVIRLAAARAYDDVDPATAEGIIRGMIDAVVDALPRTAPRGKTHLVTIKAPATKESFSERLRRLVEQRRIPMPDDRPHLVSLSLRIEADEQELIDGCCRLVLQVHDERTAAHSPTRRCCGPSPVRTRPTASATGRGPTPASRCGPRPTPGRCWTGCSSCGCPTQMTLDGDRARRPARGRPRGAGVPRRRRALAAQSRPRAHRAHRPPPRAASTRSR